MIATRANHIDRTINRALNLMHVCDRTGRFVTHPQAIAEDGAECEAEHAVAEKFHERAKLIWSSKAFKSVSRYGKEPLPRSNARCKSPNVISSMPLETKSLMN